MKVKSLSRVQLLATPRTAAHQALPSMGFARQEYWSGVPFSESCSTALQKDSNLEEPRRQGKKVYGKLEGEEKPEGEVSLG